MQENLIQYFAAQTVSYVTENNNRSNRFLLVPLKTVLQVAVISCFVKTCFHFSSHFCLGFPSCLFPSGYMTKILYAFLILHVPWILSCLIWYPNSICWRTQNMKFMWFLYMCYIIYSLFMLLIIMKTKWNNWSFLLLCGLKIVLQLVMETTGDELLGRWARWW